jgi:hypothetical protein
VVFALVAAALVSAAWLGWPAALDRVLAIAIVTCPCAFALATPLAMSRAIGRCARDLEENTRARRLALLGTGLGAAFGLIVWREPSSVAAALALVIAGFTIYGIIAWTSVFSAVERSAWTSIAFRPRSSISERS